MECLTRPHALPWLQAADTRGRRPPALPRRPGANTSSAGAWLSGHSPLLPLPPPCGCGCWLLAVSAPRPLPFYSTPRSTQHAAAPTESENRPQITPLAACEQLPARRRVPAGSPRTAPLRAMASLRAPPVSAPRYPSTPVHSRPSSDRLRLRLLDGAVSAPRYPFYPCTPARPSTPAPYSAAPRPPRRSSAAAAAALLCMDGWMAAGCLSLDGCGSICCLLHGCVSSPCVQLYCFYCCLLHVPRYTQYTSIYAHKYRTLLPLHIHVLVASAVYKYIHKHISTV